ncbi:hypothetical protein [Vibrio salinus]|uniref:hypothetical protein n=1 Tax=Vibrio salinus TaxID=2899784 RepID=UPI001E3619E0|nr:hypothetical protein [Vibrio salinus]MCE0494704.1 hypothetical protein [Vibrio salinus]
MSNRDNCSKAQKQALIRASESVPEVEKKALETLIHSADYQHYIQNLETKEIEKIQRIFPQPFDSIKIGKEIGLIK